MELVYAVQLKVGDRVADCGVTDRRSPSVLTVAAVDGCGVGGQCRVWLRLVGVDRQGFEVSKVERLPLFSTVYRVG